MEIVLRATASFFFLWGMTRAMGKRELAEMTAFELILLVTVGDLVQQGITQEDMSVTGAVLAVGTISLWVLVLAYTGWKWPRLRPAINGRPVIVVHEGEPLIDVLKAERVPLDELLESARAKNIHRLADIRVGVLEADGKFSFLTRSEQRDTEEKSKAAE